MFHKTFLEDATDVSASARSVGQVECKRCMVTLPFAVVCCDGRLGMHAYKILANSVRQSSTESLTCSMQ